MTVLFSDASGYTQMAESVDAEVVRELMNLVYDKAGEIVVPLWRAHRQAHG